MSKLTTLGQRIWEIRMGKGLTQIDLSKGICTPSMISQIESDRARPSYKILISIADKLNVPLEKLLSDVDLNLEYVSNYKMSRAMVAAKEYASAIPLLAELLEKPRGQLSTSDIMFDLAECYLHTQQYNKAKELLEQLKEFATLRKDFQLHAMLLKNDGLIEFYMKHYQLAAYQWQKALEEVEKMEQEDVFLKASLLFNLGLVNKKLGYVKGSITCYDQAAELLSDSSQNPHDIAKAYLSLGTAYRKIGNLDQAVKYSEQAIGMFECAENQLTVLKTKVQTAALYVQMGRIEEAFPMLEESVQKFRDLGNREEEGIAMVELAKLQLLMQELHQAEELCQQARNLLPELHLYQGWISRVTGKVELARNRREEAIRRFYKAADCFKQMEELAEWDATMYEIARMHVEENDLIRAYSILDDIRRFSRQMLDEKGDRAVIATPPQITVRVEDDNSQDGYAYCSAFLIHPNIAMLQFGVSIELYKVKQVNGNAVYETEAMMAPFECPKHSQLNFREMVNDAAALTFEDFCYRYSEVFE